MAKEIEIKLIYDYRQDVLDKLKNINAVNTSNVTIEDIYLSKTSDSMSNSNDLLRIRVKDNDAELTFKGKCESDDPIWHREELNVSISDPDKLLEILTALGFKIIKRNKSKRDIWMLGETEIVFIDFLLPTELNILEIEGKTMDDVRSTMKMLGECVKPVGEDIFASFDE